MKVKKILNNCVVLVEKQDGQEMIVMGQGIGYKYKASDEISKEVIDKTYILSNHTLNHDFIKILEDTPQTIFDLANEIINYGKQYLDRTLSDSIYITLIDHINFVLKRYEDQMKTQNRLYWDVRRLYAKEFAVGSYALKQIEEKLGITLWEDEAANIALHFVNAINDGKGMEAVVEVTETVRNILHIITYHFQRELDEKSINFSRLVTHLQFFVYRILERNILQDEDDFLYDQIKVKYPQEFACVERINEYTKTFLKQSLTHNEMVYLCIHIHRVYGETF